MPTSKQFTNASMESQEENIRIYCRFRPLLGKKNRLLDSYAPDSKVLEQVAKNKVANCFKFSKDSTVIRYSKETSSSRNAVKMEKASVDYKFVKVFQPTVNQEELYTNTVAESVEHLFQGYNCTIIVYGQTGSGKTHTMFGGTAEEEKGVIPRIVEDIFEYSAKSQQTRIYFSAIEVYMDRLKDLLSPKRSSFQSTSLKSPSYRKEIPKKVYAESRDALLALVAEANKKRAVGSTSMNVKSSRSHVVYTISAKVKKSDGKFVQPRMVLVDLAGSEQVKKSGVQANAALFAEARMINRSLSALGTVVASIADRKKYIPYRNSKLTKVLEPSLGGNSRTHFILTCSSCEDDVLETVSTLRFGQRLSSVRNKPVVISSRKKENPALHDLRENIKILKTQNYELMQGQLKYQTRINTLEAEKKTLKKQIEESTPRKVAERSYQPQSTASRSLSILSPKNSMRRNSGKIEQEHLASTSSKHKMDVSRESNSLRKGILVEFTDSTQQSLKNEHIMENTLAKMTKQMVSLQAEISNKNKELLYTKKLLHNKGHKTRFGFVRQVHQETRQFAEIVKKKDDNIEELGVQLKEKNAQLKFIQTKYSALELEKKALEATIVRNKGRIRFLEEALEKIPAEV